MYVIGSLLLGEVRSGLRLAVRNATTAAVERQAPRHVLMDQPTEVFSSR